MRTPSFSPNVTTDINFSEVAETLLYGFEELEISRMVGLASVNDATRAHYERRLRHYSSLGAIIVEDHGHDAMALWFPPGCAKRLLPDDGFHTPEQRAVFEEVGEHSHHAELKLGLANKPLWKLQYLCRRPESDTRGVISSLVRPVLDCASREGLPCVLECVNEEAVPIYQHYGFEVKEEFRLRGVHIWYMVKQP